MKKNGLLSLRLVIVAAVLFGMQIGFEFWRESLKPAARGNGAWIEKVSGRVRHQKALKKTWEDVDSNADLDPNDKISTADHSRADLHFGHAVIELERNSSATLRRQYGQNAVELTEGTLIAVPKQDEPLTIDLPGRPRMTITSERFGRVSLNKNPEGRYQVQLLNGDASVHYGSVDAALVRNDVHSLESADRGVPGYVFQSPQSDGVVMGTEPLVSFAWKLTDAEKFKPARAQFLEFSSDIGFTRPYFSRTLVNQARIELNMGSFPAGVSEIYYRLRDSEGRVSAVQKLLLAKTPAH